MMATIDAGWQEQWERDGFFVARDLYSPEEIDVYREHFGRLNDTLEAGRKWRDSGIEAGDPLAQYPRMVHPHRFDERSMAFMLDSRLRDIMTAVLGDEPYCAQTMFYFKPPGARGQALHQDQIYLQVQPGTCLAAWLAVDDCDAANGCLQVVPGSHRLPLLCEIPADTERSFTRTTIPVPQEMEVVDVVMKAGDVLFFHGNLIHGSEPNTTEDRFRRSLIGHYATGRAEAIARFYHPLLRFDGTEVPVDVSPGGGACGVLEDDGGKTRIVMVETHLPEVSAPH